MSANKCRFWGYSSKRTHSFDHCLPSFGLVLTAVESSSSRLRLPLSSTSSRLRPLIKVSAWWAEFIHEDFCCPHSKFVGEETTRKGKRNVVARVQSTLFAFLFVKSRCCQVRYSISFWKNCSFHGIFCRCWIHMRRKNLVKCFSMKTSRYKCKFYYNSRNYIFKIVKILT